MLPFKVKKWQLWLLVVYLTVLTSTSWQCDPRQTSCGDGAITCLIKKGESAKEFSWKSYCDGYCQACEIWDCGDYVYDNGGVSITQKCGYREDDYIEPICVATLNSACPGISLIIKQHNMLGIHPNYAALCKECPRLSTMITEEEFNNCYEDMQVAIKNATETGDEACYNYFIRGEKCDGSAVDYKKRWTGFDQSLGESVLMTFFHISCNEENTCYDNCADFCYDISQPSGNSSGGNDDDDDDDDNGSGGDNGNVNDNDNDIWTILINSPQITSVVKGEPVIFDATVSHSEGISSIKLEYMPKDGSFSELKTFNVSSDNKYRYTWESNVTEGDYIFRYRITNTAGVTEYSNKISLKLTLAPAQVTPPSGTVSVSLKTMDGNAIQDAFDPKQQTRDENLNICIEFNGVDLSVKKKNISVEILYIGDDPLIKSFYNNFNDHVERFELFNSSSDQTLNEYNIPWDCTTWEWKRFFEDETIISDAQTEQQRLSLGKRLLLAGNFKIAVSAFLTNDEGTVTGYLDDETGSPLKSHP